MVTPPQRPGGKKPAQRPIITPRDQQKASHSTGMFASDDIEETDSIDFFRREEESEKNDILDNEFNQPLVIDSGENEVKRPTSSSIVQRQSQPINTQSSPETEEEKDESIYYDHPELDDEIDETLLVSSDHESGITSSYEDNSNAYLSEEKEEYKEPKSKKPNFITKFMSDKLAQVKTYFSIQRIIGLVLVAALFGFGIYKLYPVVNGFLGAPDSNFLSRQAGDIIDNTGGVSSSNYEKYEITQVGLGTYMPEGMVQATGETESLPDAIYTLTSGAFSEESGGASVVYASPGLYEYSEENQVVPENYMLAIFTKLGETEAEFYTSSDDSFDNFVGYAEEDTAVVEYPEINDSEGLILRGQDDSIVPLEEGSETYSYTSIIIDEDTVYSIAIVSSDNQMSQNALDRLYSLNN